MDATADAEVSELETIPRPLAPWQPPADYQPKNMLELALLQGVRSDELVKLADLHERMLGRAAEEEYAKAMTACQREMPVVVKDAMNDHTKKKYARLEAVHAAIKPVYVKHGFSLSFTTGETQLPGHVRVICDIHHTGGHTTRSMGDFPLDASGTGGKTNKTDIQATGSTYSYARRYLTLMVFNITVADEDNDGVSGGWPITDEQVKVINTLFDDCQAAGHPVDMPAFWRWLRCGSLNDMPQAAFPKAVAFLMKKAKGEGEKGGKKS